MLYKVRDEYCRRRVREFSSGFESRARHANAGKRWRLNYPCIYVGSLVEARALNVPPVIYRVEALGLGILPGAWPGWGSIPHGGFSFIRKTPE